MKCDACPVKFEARKHFTREGAYFTVGGGGVWIAWGMEHGAESKEQRVNCEL